MNFSLVDTAFAQAGQQAANQPSTIEMFIMPLGFLFILYFFMIRPQAKKARDHQNLVKSLKAGDEVVTSGGIIGRIKSVADSFITIDAGGTSLKIVKEHVSALTSPKPVPAKTK